jgi:hypothetical protein
VECWTLEELAAEIKRCKCRTTNGAIKAIREIGKIKDEQRRSVMNEEF